MGKVVADENRTYRMLAGSDGWVWDIRESTTGSLVKKDQVLVRLDSKRAMGSKPTGGPVDSSRTTSPSGPRSAGAS